MSVTRIGDFSRDVVVVGGCGHVGLPLAIALAHAGADVAIYDVSEAAVKLVNDAELPFDEPGAAATAGAAVARVASTRPRIRPSSPAAENVVVVIGTPVDEHLNPDPQAIPRRSRRCADYFRDGQLLILRSTVYPGVTALVERMLDEPGRRSTWPSAPSASPRARP